MHIKCEQSIERERERERHVPRYLSPSFVGEDIEKYAYV